MGALLAFQPSGAAGPDWAAARDSIARRRGLSVQGEAPRAVKYARVNGSGSALATSDRGFLVSAGTWHHPDCGTDDTAALLRLVEERGAGALDALDGFFALVWSDGDTLVALPDHFGRLHLYCAETPNGVYLATSPVALARLAGDEPDPLAAWELLATGDLYEERSAFARVRRLAGGRRHEFRGGRPSGGAATWLLPARGPEPGDATPERFAADVGDAIEAFLPENALPDLTGGLDSRLVVGFLLERGRRCEVTCTGAETDADAAVARRLAERLGLTFHRVPPERGLAAQRSFEQVLAAAARVDGEYDAIEYATIAEIHGRHAGQFGGSVNGSGGEVLRNYWWDAGDLGATGGDAVARLLRRFTWSVAPPPFLEPRDGAEHFRGVLRRTLEGREGDPMPSLCDHAYLHLRMQCWHGAIASATNQFWPTLSPLLHRRPLETLYRIPSRRRLDNRLIYGLFERFPACMRTTPLATGFPPVPLAAGNAWRFAPGLLGLPGQLWPRVRNRLFGATPDPRAADVARALMAGGAADYLELSQMALRPLLDPARYSLFLEQARAGAAPLPLLGRLIALEAALRA